jgi:hypothetical protein
MTRGKLQESIPLDRLLNATLHRLHEAGGKVEVKAPCAWDGIDLTDMLHDLMLARLQRDRYRRMLQELTTAALDDA